VWGGGLGRLSFFKILGLRGINMKFQVLSRINRNSRNEGTDMRPHIVEDTHEAGEIIDIPEEEAKLMPYAVKRVSEEKKQKD
jgi:hypothetical protein